MSDTQNLPPGTLPTSGGYPGGVGFNDLTNPFAELDGLIRQVVAGKAFSGLVKVVAVHGGGLSSPPTVDVQPLVDQVDGLGNRTPHGIVYGLPCFRLQGGNGACILDPAIGEKGHAIICDRDISAVKATGVQSGPGSFRQNSWADGCYYGGELNDPPESYVHIINGGGINIHTPGNINITADGTISITSAQTSIDGKPFLPHEHTLVQRGGDDTGPVA